MYENLFEYISRKARLLEALQKIAPQFRGQKAEVLEQAKKDFFERIKSYIDDDNFFLAARPKNVQFLKLAKDIVNNKTDLNNTLYSGKEVYASWKSVMNQQEARLVLKKILLDYNNLVALDTADYDASIMLAADKLIGDHTLPEKDIQILKQVKADCASRFIGFYKFDLKNFGVSDFKKSDVNTNLYIKVDEVPQAPSPNIMEYFLDKRACPTEWNGVSVTKSFDSKLSLCIISAHFLSRDEFMVDDRLDADVNNPHIQKEASNIMTVFADAVEQQIPHTIEYLSGLGIPLAQDMLTRIEGGETFKLNRELCWSRDGREGIKLWIDEYHKGLSTNNGNISVDPNTGNVSEPDDWNAEFLITKAAMDVCNKKFSDGYNALVHERNTDEYYLNVFGGAIGRISKNTFTNSMSNITGYSARVGKAAQIINNLGYSSDHNYNMFDSDLDNIRAKVAEKYNSNFKGLIKPSNVAKLAQSLKSIIGHLGQFEGDGIVQKFKNYAIDSYNTISTKISNGKRAFEKRIIGKTEDKIKTFINNILNGANEVFEDVARRYWDMADSIEALNTLFYISNKNFNNKDLSVYFTTEDKQNLDSVLKWLISKLKRKNGLSVRKIPVELDAQYWAYAKSVATEYLSEKSPKWDISEDVLNAFYNTCNVLDDFLESMTPWPEDQTVSVPLAKNYASYKTNLMKAYNVWKSIDPSKSEDKDVMYSALFRNNRVDHSYTNDPGRMHNDDTEAGDTLNNNYRDIKDIMGIDFSNDSKELTSTEVNAIEKAKRDAQLTRDLAASAKKKIPNIKGKLKKRR